MATLKELLNKQNVKLEEVTEHLEKLPHNEKVEQVVSISAKEERILWDVAGQSQKEFSLDYFLPAGAPDYKLFPFEGKNSLPAFTRFQKVFYKQEDGKICGYNNQSISWFTGPGYYVVEPSPGKLGPVVIDYTQIPTKKPDALPPIKSNTAGISRFIYGGMQDFLRWVSPDVVIGRATKGGTKEMPAWFVLCRKDKY